MKQPKNDDRPPVLSKDIIKAQHIVPAKIIKKWKQDGILLTKIKNNPKLQKISNERNDLFCVYHRWSQSFEDNKVGKKSDGKDITVETLFFDLTEELAKDQRDIIKFDFTKDKETLTIIKYWRLIHRRMFYKLHNSNEEFKNFVGVESSNFTKEQQEALERKHIAYYVNNQMIGCEWMLYQRDVDVDKICAENGSRQFKEHHDWFYIRIHDKTSRFVLPDNWNNWQIISVSPDSILISQAFINYLGWIGILPFLDIKNPPIPIKKIVKLSSVINSLALKIYDKWIIL